MSEEVRIVSPPTGPEAPKVETPKPAGGDRPAWLPEKFKTAEDMAKSYTELEKKLGAPKTETPPPADKTPPPTTPTELGKDEQEALKKAGLNINDLEVEFAKNGKLSEESARKLAEAGIDQTRMDVYQRGRQALVEDFVKETVKDIKGGKEELEKAMAWAGDKLTKAEIEAFNDTMAGSNVGAAKLAAAGLVAKYANDREPQLIGGMRGNDSPDVFDSRAEILSAMSDPRYKNDPAYRARVEAKSIRSNPKY